MSCIIETFNLTKYFKQKNGAVVKAVNDINMQILQGETIGLLGHNGAGKTTLLKLLSTLIIPTNGSARINGYDLIKQARKIRSSIGYISGDERSFYHRLTGKQNLSFFCSLYNMPTGLISARINEVMRLVGLLEKKDFRYSSYSSGEKQKLSIARAILADPPVLFIDELSKSLDPVSALHLRRLIKEKLIEEQGKSVFLATHSPAEAVMMCNRIGIIRNGSIRSFWKTEDLNHLSRRNRLFKIYNDIYDLDTA